MEERYDLVTTILTALDHAGALKEVILIGSWAMHFYRILFNGATSLSRRLFTKNLTIRRIRLTIYIHHPSEIMYLIGPGLPVDPGFFWGN